MAVTIAFPPLSTLMSLPDTAGPFSTLPCGFEPGHLGYIKSEPISMEESIEDSMVSSTFTDLSSANYVTSTSTISLTPTSASPSARSLTSSSSSSFTACFSQLKQGQTDLYLDSSDPQAFRSWTYKHPEHWQSREVLDWLFSLTDIDNFDGALFKGEAYNTLTGKQLSSMTLSDFVAVDNTHGARVYHIFRWLLEGANFLKPCPPETLSGNVPDFDFLESPSDVTQAKRSAHSPQQTAAKDSKLAVYLAKNGSEMKVSIDGLGLYDIDINFDEINDSDYNSGSDGDTSSRSPVPTDVFEPMFSDSDSEDSRDLVLPELSRKTHTPSSSSDSGTELEERRPAGRTRRTNSTSKGNHLWEFVRDLLKDSRFNPSLLKWEDKEMGVFKFVQSEAVAQMWGRKKNNPGMTYEKLSRAMRFCRSAGYFDSVPKTGRFPKKLCFKFGQKAHGWKD